jgi:hypothetical protein
MERGFREQRLAGRDREPDKEGLVDQADAIAIELDHVRALEATLGCHERIDKLLMIAAARRNNALEQIERYRNAVVYRLRVASDKIIEAQFNAAGAQPSQLAAPLVPSEAQQ